MQGVAPVQPMASTSFPVPEQGPAPGPAASVSTQQEQAALASRRLPTSPLLPKGTGWESYAPRRLGAERRARSRVPRQLKDIRPNRVLLELTPEDARQLRFCSGALG